MRLFHHLIQILFLGFLLFLMVKINLSAIPYFQEILTILIVSIAIFWFVLLYFRTPKNKRKLWILFLCVFISFQSQAQFCSMAESYDKIVFEVKKSNNLKDDKPCDDSQWITARETLNKLKLSPSRFIPSDRLTVQQINTYRSFRQDSHWQDWVSENFSASGTNSAEELACASYFESLCSEYETRHPETRTAFLQNGPVSASGAYGKTVPFILEESTALYGCWPCRMALIVMQTVQGLSSKLEDAMRQAGVDILKIFMLLWILYATFLAVVFPSKGATFIKDFMTRFLCVLVASFILSSGNNALQNLYKNVLNPIIDLGIGLSQDMYSVLHYDSELDRMVNPSLSPNDNYCVAHSNRSLPDIFEDNKTYQGGFLSNELQLDLLCMTQRLYRQVSPITAVGQSLVSYALAGGRTMENFWDFVFPLSLKMWIVGCILTLIFVVFSFLVAFKVIDIFLRLGFVLVLLPLFVAAWAFPITRDFSKKGLMFLLSIISEFFGLVLSLNFIMILFESGITLSQTVSESGRITPASTALISAINAPASADYGENLYKVIVSGGGLYFFFMLIALFFISMPLMSLCTGIIHSFFGTSAVGGDVVSGVAASMTKMAANLGKKTWDIGSKAAENAESYHVPSDKSKSFVAGRALGRLRSGQNPLKDISNPFRKEADTTVSSAPKRYFGEKAGETVDKTSQRIARGLDRIGVTTGQALQKTGIGAIVGVPLTLATKTLTTVIRGSGKIISGVTKLPGAFVYGAKKAPQVLKNAPRVVWNKVTSPIKKGFQDGRK